MTRTPHFSAEPRPERILVVRNRFIGDTLLAIPFLRNLRRAFPEATIDVLVDPASGAVLAECPYKDELLTWRRPNRERGVVPDSLANIVANAARLKERSYDRAYVLKRSFSSGLLVWLAGIPHRIGSGGRGRGLLLTRTVPAERGRHEAEHFLDLLRSDGIPVDDGHNENWASDAAIDRICELLADLPSGRRRVFLAPKASNVNREWPVERMAKVAERLIERHACEICFCGARRDIGVHRSIIATMAAEHRSHAHDFTLDLRLEETGAFLAKMDLYLGVDTGLAHLAASFGVPTVVLFGPSDPNQWHPWDTPCDVLRGTRLRRPWTDRVTDLCIGSGRRPLRWPLGEAAMEDISVEQVTAAATRMLANAPRQPLRPPKFLQQSRSTMPTGS
jgi:heptosyltransferase-2